MSKYSNRPVTVHCRSEEQARELAAASPTTSRALLTGQGTLAFHLLIAQHGAGEFETLYVAPRLRGTFSSPVGGTVEEAE